MKCPMTMEIPDKEGLSEKPGRSDKNLFGSAAYLNFKAVELPHLKSDSPILSMCLEYQ